jgi:hypothetical protein
MNETNQTPTGDASRADVAWGSITRQSESGSFVEDRLASLVDTTSLGSFRVDVVHLGQVPAE